MKGESSRTERDLHERTRAREALERTLLLEVTLLGDGKDAPEYAKRRELQARLEQHRFVSRVTIPEVLYERNPRAIADDVERSAIGQADIVLCLEGPSNAALGVYTEMTKYFDRSDPDKWFYCRPTDRVERRQGVSDRIRRLIYGRSTEQAKEPGGEPLVSELARDEIKRMDTFDYDPKEWEGCGRITAALKRRIELVAYREGDRRASRFLR